MGNTTFKVKLSAKLWCGAVLLIGLVIIGLSYLTSTSITESAKNLLYRLTPRTQKTARVNATPSAAEVLSRGQSEKPQWRPSVNASAMTPKSDQSSTEPAGKIGPQLREREKGPKRYDQPREAAEFYRLKRLPTGATEIPVERYLDALEQMRKMPQYSSEYDQFLPSRAELGENLSALSLPAWTSLGPGNIGGRTRALLINPNNPQVMYAAGVAGGVWKTTNGGAAWTPLDDLLPNLAVSSLAMDPTNPNVIYAGTGEGYFNVDSVRGAGIFKTTDGARWAPLTSTTNSDFHYVNDIVVSPVNSQRVYAATRTGVWRSLDGGSSWTNVLNPANSSGNTVFGGCLDLAIRTDQSTDFIFASCGTFEQATVYCNTDAGRIGAWRPVLTESGMGRTSLAIAPSNQNIVYAAASSIASGDYYAGLHAVFRSTTGGASGSWTATVRNTDATKLNTLLFTNPISASSTECQPGSAYSFYSQGDYDNVIAVDPLDPNRLWVGGIDLFRSDDGGANWGLASYWWTNKSNPHYAHADHHVIAFHPQYNGSTNRQMFIGTDGGVFRTDDARAFVARGSNAACNSNASGVTWTSLNNNYGVTQFYHGAPYPNGITYFGGTQDNGTIRGNDSSGANAWNEIRGGDGGYVAVDPTNTSTLYVEYIGISIQKSTDGGASFNNATSGISDQGLFITPFTMDPSNSQRLWTGGRFMWRTDNGAGSWVMASSQVTNGGISAIAVAPTNPNIVLAGSSLGRVARTIVGTTANAATSWSFSQTPRGLNAGYISWLTFDPTNANIAYATVSNFNAAPPAVGHVFKSIDGGQTWTSIDGSGATGIPDIPVHCIVVDPANTSRLFVGTDLGVFASTDGGATWMVENTGFANVTTESLAVNRTASATNLFAFTHGRGAWRVNISSSGGPSCPTVTNISPASGAPGTSVTITGANFTGVNAVRFANNVMAQFTVNSDTRISTTVPQGAVTGSITISKPNCADTTTTVFTVTGSCTYSINPTSQSFLASGGDGSVSVTTSTNCAWQATSNVNWIIINSGASGSGNGTVRYSVQSNPGAGSRTGSLTIAGQNFTVTQSGGGASCPVVTSITPSSGATGTNVTITGANFTGVTAVKFANNVTATFNVNNDAQITTTVPPGAVSGPITISKSGCSDTQTGVFIVSWYVIDHVMTAGPIRNDCSQPTPKYAFAVTDARAYQWTRVSDARTGDMVRWDFIAPNGSLFQERLTVPCCSSGEACLFNSILITGSAAASLPGNWQVRVFFNGAQILTENFTIG